MGTGELEKPTPPLSTRFLLIASTITAYNVFALHQGLFELSRSVHWLASIWRHVLGLPFEWLHLNLRPLQREAIILLMFFTGAALAPLRRYKKLTLYQTFRFMFRPMTHEDRQLIESVGGHKGSLGDYVIYVLFAAGLSWLMVATVLPTDLPPPTRAPLSDQAEKIFIVVCLMFYPVVFAAWYISSKSARIKRILSEVMEGILNFIANWLSLMAGLYRPILNTWKIFTGLLALDLIFKFALDPLLAVYPTLPCPPNMGRC